MIAHCGQIKNNFMLTEQTSFHHSAENIEVSVPILLAMRLLLREVNKVKSKKIGTLNIRLFATQIVVKMHVIVAAVNKRSLYHLW